jgi:hypothetical protein
MCHILTSFIDVFYRYSFGMSSGRAFIFTTYDFKTKVTTNICLNFIPKALPLIGKHSVRVAQSYYEQPLALHIFLATHVADCWDVEGSNQRTVLLRDVSTK